MGYAHKAKSGTLSLQEMAGGNFTISNGSMNPPVAVNGQVEVRPIMAVALTYDSARGNGEPTVHALEYRHFCVCARLFIRFTLAWPSSIRGESQLQNTFNLHPTQNFKSANLASFECT